ncbi:unnamed protein product [Microthlaspi erraticum]|uniref:Uncharacterized protein n=1 Tax=Microthlaspi erraticum TaxID=1685480 RepID=A0A6D2JSZ9_9BRAS|nr:unnamed protein product [Microthlaspi erraticum]
MEVALLAEILSPICLNQECSSCSLASSSMRRESGDTSAQWRLIVSTSCLLNSSVGQSLKTLARGGASSRFDELFGEVIGGMRVWKTERGGASSRFDELLGS